MKNIEKMLEEYNKKMDLIDLKNDMSLDEMINYYKKKMDNIDNESKNRSEYIKLHEKFQLEKSKRTTDDIKVLIKQEKQILKRRYNNLYPFLEISDHLLSYFIELEGEEINEFEKKYEFSRFNEIAKNNKINKNLFYELEKSILKVKYLNTNEIILDIISKKAYEEIKKNREEKDKSKRQIEKLRKENELLEESKLSYEKAINEKESKIFDIMKNNKKLSLEDKELIIKLENDKENLMKKLKEVKKAEGTIYIKKFNDIIKELFYDSNDIIIDKSILEILNKKIENDMDSYLENIKEIFKKIRKNEDIKKYKIFTIKEFGEILVINNSNNVFNYEFNLELIKSFKDNKSVINKLMKQTFYEFYKSEKNHVNLSENIVNYRSEASNYSSIIETELENFKKYIRKYSEFRGKNYFTLNDYTDFFGYSYNFQNSILKETNELGYHLKKDAENFRIIRNKASHGKIISYEEYIYIRENTIKILKSIQKLNLSMDVLNIR